MFNVDIRITSKAVVVRYRRVLVFVVQLLLVVASYMGSFYLRTDMDIGEFPVDLALKTLPLIIVIRMAVLVIFRLNRGLWQYVSVLDLIQIMRATTVSTLLLVPLVIILFGLEGFPRSIFILDWVGNVFLLSGARLSIRLMRERFWPTRDILRPTQRLLIVGAGDAGAELCRQALGNGSFRVKPVAYVDDDPRKVGGSILGVPIVASTRDIPQVVGEYRIDTVIIAIPYATPSKKRSLMYICQQANVPCKILPPIEGFLDDVVNLSRIRDIEPADLLGRDRAELDRASIVQFIQGKKVLVTGAGGSIGSELAHQIAGFNPQSLIILDNSENSLFFLEAELRSDFPDFSLVVRVGDVIDEIGVRKLIAECKPDIVIHAAAHKHVPLMELVPAKAVTNNIGGTYVMAKCAQEADVDTFILVSTDKSVNPTSVMGATKRFSELLIQDLNRQGPTRFVSVRFGNVLGSNASVVPIFKQQIANGGPITVTHPEVDRYFMSIPEAVGLILQAGSVCSGGEIYVLDMGDPVKIVELAEMVITLAGFQPYEDIDIVYTGLRPGEKLSEELHFDSEEFEVTNYDKLLVLKENHQKTRVLDEVESLLKVAPSLDADEVKLRLRNLIPEYHPEIPAVTSDIDTTRLR